MKRYLYILILLWLGPLAPSMAQSIQSLESIQESVRLFLEQETAGQSGEIEIQVGRLDSRLRLGECEQEMKVFWPDGARRVGNVTLGVSCERPSWSLFVRAGVEVMEPILVSSRPLSRGTVLGENDFEVVKQGISRLSSGYYTVPDQVIGAVMTRSVRAGTVFTPSLLKPAALVRRGDYITILAITGGLQVRMEGEALADGALGDVIRVRNISSRQEIEGEVIGVGQVQVRM